MLYSRVVLAGLVICLAGCCGPKIETYAGAQPKLDIRQYMNGGLEAWGSFISSSGKADPRFYATANGVWEGNDGTLSEHFLYNDGHKQQRIWHLHMLDNHHFTGTAGDVVGTAQGTQYGNTVHMLYTLRLTRSGSTHDVSMDDWLYLVDDTHLVNRTRMSKFGYTLGELVIAFHKTGDDE